MVINSNVPAQSGARILAESSASLAKSLARLSSGSKITSPEDDAAGLAVSMRLDAQISRIGAAINNLGNAVSYSQTQDGFLQKVATALNRMSELSVLAQDATKTTTDDALYNAEFVKLSSYVNDLTSKDFNGVSLFDPTASALRVNTDADANTVTLDSVDGAPYDLSAYSVSDPANATSALSAIKTAIGALAIDRANVGANISVLNSYTSQLGVLKDNITTADSRIKDVDVAQESTNYARYNILVQSGTAMLAQANQMPQSVLKLLG
jgi:flagellin